MHFLAAASKIVLNLSWLCPVNVLCVKYNLDWLAGPLLGPDTGLKHSNVFFVIVFLKPCFFLYVNTINNIVIGSCLILRRVSFIKEIAYTNKVASWLSLKSSKRTISKRRSIHRLISWTTTFWIRWALAYVGLHQLNNGFVFKLFFVQQTEDAIQVLMPVAHDRCKFMLDRGKFEFFSVSDRDHAEFLVSFDVHFWFSCLEEAGLKED